MLNDTNDFDWVLATRYLTGDLSPAEAEAAERWLQADPRHRAGLEELRAVWEAVRGDVSGWNTEKAIAELRSRAERSPRAPLRPVQSRTREIVLPFSAPRRSGWLAAAATIAAMIAGIALLRVSSRDEGALPVAAAPNQTEIRTERGEQKEVRLPDGTHVLLAAATSLRYDSDFGVQHRIVDLDGEAYFEAVHEGAGPLQVRTPEGLAQDIGTAFVVRAYAASPMQVVVTEGAVMLRANRASAVADSLVLQSRQLGRVLSNGELEFVRRVNPDNYISWTRGQLAFADAPLSDVARELRRWYNADVRVANKRAAQRRFTGSFTRGQIDDAVGLIAAVADVSVRRNGAGWIFE